MERTGPVYIHYGHDSFEPEKFRSIRNDRWRPKPAEGTGLWASRLDDPLGWKNWCLEDNYRCDRLETFYTFCLKPTANVLYISSPEDLADLPKHTLSAVMQEKWDQSFLHPTFLDYEVIAASGIDAIELVNQPALAEALYMWDCNCILILNPDIITLTGQE